MFQTPPLTRARSPYTVSSQASSRNMLSTPSAAQLVDENRYLNEELNRVETMLNSTRAEKDEIGIRYNALSDRVSSFSAFRKKATFCTPSHWSKTLGEKNKKRTTFSTTLPQMLKNNFFSFLCEVNISVL